jgi:hypothetical protein
VRQLGGCDLVLPRRLDSDLAEALDQHAWHPCGPVDGTSLTCGNYLHMGDLLVAGRIGQEPGEDRMRVGR